MNFTSAIFDIDGLLIDSEPLWNEAAAEVFAQYGIRLSPAQYATTTGLRTPEFVSWWFSYFGIDSKKAAEAEEEIVARVLRKIAEKATVMPGVKYIFEFLSAKSLSIGLATSSPPALIELAIEMTGIGQYLQATSSAEGLPYGKPHPQVYLNCAEKLGADPVQCLCFEDSYNGMIAVKAARMTCVVVPHAKQLKHEKWGAADLKLSSLQNFSQLHFDLLQS
ncbi:MAG TPA: hexitol phosphatase HxpB [Sediminibacterium sp.]|nr:hexitol phosphatase HxpB [Sediminibacterium sp.]